MAPKGLHSPNFLPGGIDFQSGKKPCRYPKQKRQQKRKITQVAKRALFRYRYRRLLMSFFVRNVFLRGISSLKEKQTPTCPHLALKLASCQVQLWRTVRPVRGGWWIFSQVSREPFEAKFQGIIFEDVYLFQLRIRYFFFEIMLVFAMFTIIR